VEAIGRGDQAALHALYDRSYRLVFTLIMRITRSRETAEELTVDVFHDVWRRAGGYEAANGMVVGWILNQARSRAIDRLRFDNRKKRVDPYPNQPAQEPPSGADTLVASDQDRRRLQSALSQLSPDEKQAIECAFFGDKTHAEVAVELDTPLGTIKTRIRSGLHKLRSALEKAGEP
jgi:RNA polymerase sigma-70 factor (ECF subfamily)